MGEEIQVDEFSKQDFRRFSERLREETFLFREQLSEGLFDCDQPRAGFELEAALVDAKGDPICKNPELMETLSEVAIEAELAEFNFELNGDSHALEGNALSNMEADITKSWNAVKAVAEDLGATPIMVGTLPTIKPEHLCVENMSKLHRYKALNEQLLKLREDKPFTIDIEGEQPLHVSNNSVMVESTTTSFQVHLQVNPEDSVRLFNASLVAAAPLISASANSPYLFGKSLWAESRVPLFEQAVASMTPSKDPDAFVLPRVTMGQGYARDSLWWLYSENRQHYSVLLPAALSDDPAKLEHMHLHNGTIWRWVRPIASFDDQGKGVLRIEQRVLPSGPTILDSMANMAFYYGLIYGLSHRKEAASSLMLFPQVKDNFYACAKEGLDADIQWIDGKTYNVRYLLSEQLLPLAETGLNHLGLDSADIRKYLGVVAERVERGINGATWQRQYLAKHQCDASALTLAYIERQQTQQPVHDWDL